MCCHTIKIDFTEKYKSFWGINSGGRFDKARPARAFLLSAWEDVIDKLLYKKYPLVNNNQLSYFGNDFYRKRGDLCGYLGKCICQFGYQVVVLVYIHQAGDL